ncbi:5'/3'-nucleotidase SurE [Gimesia chilikensis]|uniref:5'-nucleotidase SurE n=1 Tax=Gimesia chilikensis TaxID=2605989 RepID=A0A517PS99_9PLAN|nr:5'/3'-nucleotidase SurE [Gimesia chilikensis]QDT22253.1 5'-nucleotidase SurE [Gimesia chilikensis]
MQILLTNDDGIHAPGLRSLRAALTQLGDVEVVAPLAEQSGVGLSITYLHPLMIHQEFEGEKHWGWAVAGSPADCVKLGILEFCSQKPDLIVSGINSGSNVGINVLYSGTVAGAIEGAFAGIPSIAVSAASSFSNDVKPDYDRWAEQSIPIIRQLMAQQETSADRLWNINFPETRPEWPCGVKWTSLGVKRHFDVMEKRIDPRGRPYFWSGLDPIINHQLEAGTDIKELSEGYVTVTPLKYDITDHERLNSSDNTPGQNFDLPPT